jgi:hypothetical protein
MNDSYRYYVIRHIKTGELMPQMKRDRGYSHWNPDNPKEINKLGVPRLIDTRRRAVHCINQWAALPNAVKKFSTSYYGEEKEDIDIKPDGRKKEDLEVVEVNLELTNF